MLIPGKYLADYSMKDRGLGFEEEITGFTCGPQSAFFQKWLGWGWPSRRIGRNLPHRERSCRFRGGSIPECFSRAINSRNCEEALCIRSREGEPTKPSSDQPRHSRTSNFPMLHSTFQIPHSQFKKLVSSSRSQPVDSRLQAARSLSRGNDDICQGSPSTNFFREVSPCARKRSHAASRCACLGPTAASL